MALSFDLKTDSAISFEEFTAFASDTILINEPDSVLECTEKFQQLSNNNEFLPSYVNAQLEQYLNFQTNNLYTSQTLIVHSTPKYIIRANAWPVVGKQEIKSARTIDKQQQDLFFFLKAHDHNFSFLTVGYLGGGYTTEIWEYNNDSVVGFTGEKVELKYLETTKLPKGKAMYYKASKDIHIQYPPDDYSISLNLIPNAAKLVLEKEQYYFDVETQTISGITPTSGSGRHLLFDLAQMFSNDVTVELIDKIAEVHTVPYMRVKAYESLAALSGDANRIWEKALNDKHYMVSERDKLSLKNNDFGK
jgi:hypothetical protein